MLRRASDILVRNRNREKTHDSRKQSGDSLSLALTSNGRYLLVGNINGTIDLWDAETGNKLKTIKGHLKRIVSVTVSSDNKYLVSGAWDKTVKIWNIDSGTLINSIEAHEGNVNSVVISTDDRYIASGGDDSSIKGWGV